MTLCLKKNPVLHLLMQTCSESGTTCRVTVQKTNRATADCSLILSYVSIRDEFLLQSTDFTGFQQDLLFLKELSYLAAIDSNSC